MRGLHSEYDTILANPTLWSFSIPGYFDVANSFGHPMGPRRYAVSAVSRKCLPGRGVAQYLLADGLELFADMCSPFLECVSDMNLSTRGHLSFRLRGDPPRIAAVLVAAVFWDSQS